MHDDSPHSTAFFKLPEAPRWSADLLPMNEPTFL
jgi:hypothetical protein